MNIQKFSVYLRQKRIENALSQGQLADLLMVSKTTISKWENAVCYPDRELFSDIAAVLHIPEKELLTLRNGEECSVKDARFVGTLVKEALNDVSVLSCLHPDSVGLQESVRLGGRLVRFATVIRFSSDDPELPEKLSKALCEDAYIEMEGYADKGAYRHYCICKDAVFSYAPGNYSEAENVKAGLQKRFLIPNKRLNVFTEEKK